STLTAGVHLIQATYNGDNNYQTSSDGVWQVVNNSGLATTTLTVTGPTGPVLLFKKPVKPLTLTIELTSATAGSLTGSNSVMLVYDDNVLPPPGGLPLQTSGCNPGALACATFTTTQLTVGPHRIVVVFGGDVVKYGGTVSVPISVSRSPKPHY